MEGLDMVVGQGIRAVIILYVKVLLVEWFLLENHGFRVQLH